jgi:hypothetical protein
MERTQYTAETQPTRRGGRWKSTMATGVSKVSPMQPTSSKML